MVNINEECGKMIIRFAICDDELHQRQYLQKIVTDWATDRQHTIRISTYDSAEAFLFAADEDQSFDILLLDIQMKELDGIQLAKKQRESDERSQIIFITGFHDFIGEGYDVSALHYLMKPVSEDKLCEVLDKAVAWLSTQPRTIVFEVDRTNVRIAADDICYAEVFSHEIALHTTSQPYRLLISMNELEALLGDGFFRCHRSYIAGLRHVSKVTRKAMVLDNGMELPLSRNLYDAANQAFIQYN